MDLAYGLINRYAKSIVAIEDGNADLGLGYLPFEVLRHELLAKLFHTVHLRLDAASAVISTPVSPNSTGQVSLRIDHVVAGNRSGTRRPPRPCIFAWGYHFLGQFCGIAKMHLVAVHAAFGIAWLKYTVFGVHFSWAV